MIQKTDLRPGFWVAFNPGNHPLLTSYHQVMHLEETTFRASGFPSGDGANNSWRDFEYTDERLSHIPITSEWLQKLGFLNLSDKIYVKPAKDWDGNKDLVTSEYNFRLIPTEDGYKCCYTWPCTHGIPVRLLHELQYQISIEEIKPENY